MNLEKMTARDLAHELAMEIAGGMSLGDEHRWKIEEILVRSLQVRRLRGVEASGIVGPEPPKPILQATCAVCGEPWDSTGKHECKAGFSEVELAMTGVMMRVTVCDHYCCGLAEHGCQARTLLKALSDAGYALTKSAAPVASPEVGAQGAELIIGARSQNIARRIGESLRQAEPAKPQIGAEELSEILKRIPLFSRTWLQIAEDILAALQAGGQPKKDGWIAVSERLPDFGKKVLVAIYGETKQGYRNEFFKSEDEKDWQWRVEGMSYYGQSRDRVTHWRELPAAPKVEAGGQREGDK